MHVVISPDSFKGSLTALEACEAMQKGVHAVFPEAGCDLLPMADGGEGTVDALVNATGGRFCSQTVRDPLGRPVEARWGLLGDKRTAVIEMAAASGLPLLRENERDPRRADTFGTGELIAAALAELHKNSDRPRLIIGIGGSATNDGGAGAMRALGARFYNADNRELPPGGAPLSELARIDLSGLHPLLARTEIMVACDVDNPLTGERGASAVFGPQKGAGPSMVKELDAALSRYALVAAEATGKNVAVTPGAGAAGGLGAGLLFFTPARLKSGIDIVLEAVDFGRRVAPADLVLTGEGHSDFQTAYGKAPAGVAGAAKKMGKPVICISGGLGRGVEQLYEHGIDALSGAVCAVSSLEDCMEKAGPMLESATERVMRVFRLGLELRR